MVTNDNPRTEPAEEIVNDILTGMKAEPSVYKELDRKKAIWYAFTQASEHDVVLVAGKGHEDYQVVGEQALPFDERAIVASLVTGAE